MKNLVVKVILAGCLVSPGLVAHANEGTATDWSRLVSEGTAAVDFRYRFEAVDDQLIDKDARASTLRSRLTLSSAELSGFAFLLEFDDVTSVLADDYNSTENGNAAYPVVADPEGTDLNQAWARFARGQASATLGRQRILHGSQRFVGGVGWRQNEQTFDALRLQWEPVTALKLDYSYIAEVRRLFGPRDGANPAQLEGDVHALRIDYTVVKGHRVSGYYYNFQFDPRTDYAAGKTVNLSSETLGGEYSGSWDWLSVNAAYARQQEAGDSQLDYTAGYYFAEVGAQWQPLSLKVGVEVLASDSGVGFATPLATAHKFQGWADKFLATPGDGVTDLYVNLAGKVGPVALAGIYHQFEADSSSEEFGKELDLVATWPVNKMLTVQAHYASFASDSSRFGDVDKAWLTLQLKL